MSLAQYAEGGLFAPAKIADLLRTTSQEVAASAGLARDAVQPDIRWDGTRRASRGLDRLPPAKAPRRPASVGALALRPVLNDKP